MCEKEPSKSKYGMEAFPSIPMFENADNLAAEGRGLNLVVGRPEDIPQDCLILEGLSSSFYSGCREVA